MRVGYDSATQTQAQEQQMAIRSRGLVRDELVQQLNAVAVCYTVLIRAGI